MVLTFAQAATVAAKLHIAAEAARTRDGKFTGTAALIQPEGRVSTVLPFGPGGTPPSDAFMVEHAILRGAAGLVITGDYLVDPTPLKRRQAALDPVDLP